MIRKTKQHNHKNIADKSMNYHMFIDDFVSSIIYAFSQHNHDIFKIEPASSMLRNLLNCKDNNFTYDFPKEIVKLAHQLFIYGKTSIDIEIHSDKGIIDEIIINCHDSYSKVSKRINIYSRVFNSSVNVKVPNCILTYFINLKINDIGIMNYERRKMLKELLTDHNMDILHVIGKRKIAIDFDQYREKNRVKMLSAFNSIPWNGRDFDSSITTEPYNLYRLTHFKIVQAKLLNYIIGKINNGLLKLGEIYGFNGKLVYDVLDIETAKGKLDQMLSGELPFEEMSRVLFPLPNSDSYEQ